MGVRTVVFGKFAWQYLHGLCQWLDAHEHDRKLAIRVLSALVWIMPCIYCRRSAAVFITKDKLNPTKIGKKHGSDTFKEWAYRLHQQVNMKLFWQDVKNNKPRIWSHWLGYQPPLKKVKYVKALSKHWLSSVIQFFAYVVCDYPTEQDDDYSKRKRQIQLFLPNLGKLVGVPFGKLMDLSQMSVDERLRAVHQVYHRLVPKECCEEPEVFLDFCKAAIVGGCQKIDPKKVGCM